MPASRARRTRVVLDLVARQQDTDRPFVVIKVGGSLLGWPPLIDRIEWLLSERHGADCLMMCGGGQAADLVRRWQQAYELPDEQAHQLALRAVAFNEALLGSVLPRGVVVPNFDEAAVAWEEERRPILACDSFLRDHEPESTDSPLPHNWDVTSDSIAAWCTRQLGADELILAKSADLPPDLSVTEAAGRGLVDAYFPNTVPETKVSWSNLRADVPTIVDWL